MIDLEDPGLELLVEEDVEAEDLEAHRVLDVVRLARPVRVRQLGLHRADRLDDGLFDVVEDPRRVVAHLLDVLHGEGEAALVAQVVLLAALVLDVVARHLVDRVVRQVHVEVVEIVLVGRSILASGQSAKALLVEQDPERVDTAEQNVDPQVKLQLVDQEWLMQVALHNIVFIGIEVFQVAR